LDFTQLKCVFTDVSGHPICPLFKDQTILEQHILLDLLGFLTTGADRLCRNIWNCQYTLCNISEERISQKFQINL